MSRHFSDLNSVLEFDALNDLWQLVLAVQSPPCFRAAVTSLNTMSLAVFARDVKDGARCQREIVGRDARMRCEKSGAPSAARAASLIRERCRNSSNGSVVSIRPER